MKKKMENQIAAEVDSLFESGIVGDKTAYNAAVKLYLKSGKEARYDKRFENIGLYAVANPVKPLPKYERENHEIGQTCRYLDAKSARAWSMPV